MGGRFLVVMFFGDGYFFSFIGSFILWMGNFC